MNERRLEAFEVHVNRAIQPIAARPGRKRSMREEMLSHLQSSYDEELRRNPDEFSAVDAAIKRLGDIQELGMQLQASVPFLERLLFLCLDRKEILMTRWLWIVGVLAWFIGATFTFPLNEQCEFGGMAIFFGSTFWNLFQRDNIASRLLGPRWFWLVGCIEILFGIAVVLPAMAKIKAQGSPSWLTLEAMMLGVLIVLAGAAFLTRGVKGHYTPPA